MGRFVLGVLFAVLAVWGYDRVFGSTADAGSGGGGGPVAPGAGESSGPKGLSEFADPTPPGPSRETDAASAGEADGAASFAELRVASGARRDALLGTLSRRLRDAADLGAALAVLGTDNAFLHSAEGRAAAEQVAERCVAAEPWAGVRASTRLLEAAANGELRREDADARAGLDRLRQRHDLLVRRTVFDPADLSGARRYEVRSGDSLTTVARALSKSIGLPLQAGTLQLVNRIDNPNVIRQGQGIKAPVEPIRTVVWKSSFLVTVYVGDVVVRSYPCAHGKPGHETPETVFTLGATTENPDWHYGGDVIAFGDPRNPLGTHFVQFQHESYSGFGIHGTNEPESMGTQASLGCIRLGAAEIAEFARFVPRGTKVEVRR